MSDNKTRRALNSGERNALEQYARLEIPLDELVERLNQVAEFRLGPIERRIDVHYERPEPPIQITPWHIDNVQARKKRGDISEHEVAEWASMLLLIDAYDWEGPNEDVIAEWLNDLALLT
jgi:hypothetical protein